MRSRAQAILVAVGLALLLGGYLSPCAAEAEDEEPAAAEDPAARPSYFLLPIEFDGDSGAANGDALIGRLIPTNSFALGDRWRLMNLAIVMLADAPGGRPGSPGNPDSIPSPQVFGLGDLTDAVMLGRPDGWWSLGLILGIPTATDQALGSGKWSAGPAWRLSRRSGPWLLSLLAGNLKSFAGDRNRGDVHQLLVRGIVRYTFNEKWFFIYAPIITANWNASSDQRWLIPVGGG
ncbi:MAG: neuromedin U, partial [Acidobacteriota bacterium]